jgi:uncharacterized protein
MDQRITLVTLGVADVEASAAFYERLGWTRSSQSQPGGVAFFDAGGIVFALFGIEDLAEDAGLSGEGSGFRGMSLALNLASKDKVDAVFVEAEAAGARIIKPATGTFWGGYAGYFADPDGHLWEIAHNPFWPLDDKGLIQLPG